MHGMRSDKRRLRLLGHPRPGTGQQPAPKLRVNRTQPGRSRVRAPSRLRARSLGPATTPSSCTRSGPANTGCGRATLVRMPRSQSATPQAKPERPQARTEAAAAQRGGPPRDYPTLAVLGNLVGPIFPADPFKLGEYAFDFDVSPIHAVSINTAFDFFRKNGVFGWAFWVGPQFFLTGNKPLTGLYLWPRVAYGRVRARSSRDVFSVAGTIGYERLWKPVALRLGIGAMYSPASTPCACGSREGPAILFDVAFGFGG